MFNKIKQKISLFAQFIRVCISLNKLKLIFVKCFDLLKNVVLKLNSKILFLTDKIYDIYNKKISGKPGKLVEILKSFIKNLINLIKKVIFFVIAFCKKDKKRAIIYFIVLYIIYKIIFVACAKINSLFVNAKNEMIVSVRQVFPERITREINCYGYLESENNLHYTSEVRGNIDKILVQEKQQVKAGQLLMILDSKFTANTYTSAKSILESKKFQYDAIKKLYNDGLESKGNLKAMEADLENANSNFESAKKAYNGLMVYAPFDGYIDNINHKDGAQIVPGMELFTLERTNTMQIKCDVQNLFANEVNTGDAVKIFISGHEMATGNIAVIGDSIDINTGSRTILVKNIVENSGFEGRIKPGMSAMMKINAKVQQDTYMISSEALETTDHGAFRIKTLNPENGEISAENVIIYDERDGIDYVTGLNDGVYVVERGHEFVAVGEKDIQFKKVNEISSVGFFEKTQNIKNCLFKIKLNIDDFIKNLPEFIEFLKNKKDILIKKIDSFYSK